MGPGMSVEWFIKGIIIGFLIAMPVGPIGVLCIRRTLAEGRLSGMASGLGAATADACYGCLSGFGLTFITGALTAHQDWLQSVGGAVLCWLGWRTFRAHPFISQVNVAHGRGLVGAYASTFLLTLTNPMTILAFAGIFAGAGLGAGPGSRLAAGLLIAGVFTGSSCWWLLLSGAVGLMRARVGEREMQWINRLSGAVIIAFGIVAFLHAL